MLDMLAFGVPSWLESLSVWWVTGIMGLILYWMPLVVCVIVYFTKGVKIYFKLRQDRVGEGEYKNSWFNPEDLTVGHIIAFTFVSVCPVVNMIAFFYEAAGDIISFICKRIEKFFTMSLVPDSDKYKKIRKAKEKEY